MLIAFDIGNTTIAAGLPSGLHFGRLGLAAASISGMGKELGGSAPEMSSIDAYEPHLVLEGSRIIHERNIGRA
ncbi:MAG: hypothetical protein FJY82_13525 [Candidatus Aminicenantes bacterium]|nr:hypothetical protein [Candidatus Aminicenantes bacterium]